MSENLDISTSVTSEGRDWVEHPLSNATAESYGKSLAAVSVTSTCGIVASVASSVTSLYNDTVQSCLNMFSNFFHSHDSVFSSLETQIDNAASTAQSLTSGNDIFATISYIFALDGLLEFFSGVYFDSLLFFVQFIGYFLTCFIGICVVIMLYKLTLKLIRICSLGFIDAT